MITSFDVTNLFPSIDVDFSLNEFEQFLSEINIASDKKSVYVEVAKVCMEQNFFQFRNEFYRVEKGTNMGNPLSSLISELFMAALERQLAEKELLPRVWYRFVDDDFAVIEKNKLNELLNALNSQFQSKKFTCETEDDDKLAILDLQVIKKPDNSLEFSIYHKPTSKMRVITSYNIALFGIKKRHFIQWQTVYVTFLSLSNTIKMNMSIWNRWPV